MSRGFSGRGIVRHDMATPAPGWRCLSSPVAACGAPKAQGLMNVSIQETFDRVFRACLYSSLFPCFLED